MVASDHEQDLVALSRTGDHGAFETLIQQHQRMIHSLCYRMTGSLADAEDLAQETFIHAYRHLASFRGEARFSSWLYRIAVNRCLNWRQRARRQGDLLRKWGEQEATDSGPDAARSQAVQEALLKLDPKQRAAVALVIYDGLTHGEAARTLGCSETTVSWRLFMARRTLKRILSSTLISPTAA